MLEIACFDLQSALIAAEAGADRIEFCDNFSVGGTTPSLQEFQFLKTKISIPIYVMIRPRGGNFNYSETELIEMEKAILEFKENKADGFVFGILDESKEIDIKTNARLVRLADGLPCTFHRAFDETPAYQKSLEDVIFCGFKTILTSGSKPNALEGKENLAELVRLAANRIEILCGGGVRSGNVEEIKKATAARWFHSSALTNQTHANAEEIKKLKKAIS